jgi:hypothetical protein
MKLQREIKASASEEVVALGKDRILEADGGWHTAKGGMN